jgi:hypothetical protein
VSTLEVDRLETRSQSKTYHGPHFELNRTLILSTLPFGGAISLIIVCLGPYNRTIGDPNSFFDFEKPFGGCLLSLCGFYGCVKQLAKPLDPGIHYNIVLLQPVSTVSYFEKVEIVQTNPSSVFTSTSTTSRPWLSLYRRPTVRIRTRLVLLILGRLCPLGHFLWLALCLTIIHHCTPTTMRWACHLLRALCPHT